MFLKFQLSTETVGFWPEVAQSWACLTFNRRKKSFHHGLEFQQWRPLANRKKAVVCISVQLTTFLAALEGYKSPFGFSDLWNRERERKRQWREWKWTVWKVQVKLGWSQGIRSTWAKQGLERKIEEENRDKFEERKSKSRGRKRDREEIKTWLRCVWHESKRIEKDNSWMYVYFCVWCVSAFIIIWAFGRGCMGACERWKQFVCVWVSEGVSLGGCGCGCVCVYGFVFV